MFFEFSIAVRSITGLSLQLTCRPLLNKNLGYSVYFEQIGIQNAFGNPVDVNIPVAAASIWSMVPRLVIFHKILWFWFCKFWAKSCDFSLKQCLVGISRKNAWIGCFNTWKIFQLHMKIVFCLTWQHLFITELGPSALGSFSTSNSECGLRNHKSKIVLVNTHEACALVTASHVRLVSGVMTHDFHPWKYTD